MARGLARELANAARELSRHPAPDPVARAYRALVGEGFPDDLAPLAIEALLVAYWLRLCRGPVTGAAPPQSWEPLGLPAIDAFFETLLTQTSGPWGSLSCRTARKLARTDLASAWGEARRPWEPLVAFHEEFLAAYDAGERRRHGVYHTPLELVRGVVQALDGMARTSLGLAQGLADESPCPEAPLLRFWDPAVGTGAFLLGVVEHLHGARTEASRSAGASPEQIAEDWRGYAARLLDRLVGTEIRPAPWLLCQVNLALLLRETGFGPSGSTLRIELADALDRSQAEATVILGNPPFQGASARPGPAVAERLDRYKAAARRNEAQLKALSNDYVKFLALAHDCARHHTRALIGLIAPRGCLEGPLFAEMRRGWLEDFAAIALLELQPGASHPERRRHFPVRLGLQVAFLARHPAKRQTVRHGVLDAGGPAADPAKPWPPLETLCPQGLNPAPPYFRFVPEPSDGGGIWTMELDALFGTGDRRRDRNQCWSGGFKTRHDRFAVALRAELLVPRLDQLADEDCSEAELRARYRLCTTAHFDFARARRAAQQGLLADRLRRVLYRPFDWRWVVWAREVLCEPQSAVTDGLWRPNLCLVTSRVVKDETWRHVTVSRGPVEVIALSPTTSTNAYMFPLYRYREGHAEANLSPEGIARLTAAAQRPWVPQGWGGPEAIGPERVLAYLYALLHAQGYRDTFAARLKCGFPPVVLPRAAALFEALADLGADLLALHLLEPDFPHASWNRAYPPVASPFERARPAWSGAGRRVEHVAFHSDGPTGTLHWNPHGALEGVSARAWDYRVGRYRVIERWLETRRRAGLELDDAEIAQLSLVARSLAASVELEAEIDAAIARHGSWPHAFVADAPRSSRKAES